MYASFELGDLHKKMKNHLAQVYRTAKKIDKSYEPFAIRIASEELRAKRKAAYTKRSHNKMALGDLLTVGDTNITVHQLSGEIPAKVACQSMEFP